MGESETSMCVRAHSHECGAVDDERVSQSARLKTIGSGQQLVELMKDRSPSG